MGKFFTIRIVFKPSLNSNEALPYLFGEAFKDFFIPVGVRYGFNFRDKEPLRGILGMDPVLVHFSTPLFENENLISEIYLTKYHGDNFVSELIDVVSRKKLERGSINVAGIVNIYYQENSSVNRNWFLREKHVGESMKIIAFGGTEYPINEYLIPILRVNISNDENYISVNLATSSHIFLKNRYEMIAWERKNDIIMDNSIAGDLNLAELVNRVYRFTDEFLNDLESVEYQLEGSLFFNEQDRIESKLKKLPKFIGFG